MFKFLIDFFLDSIEIIVTSVVLFVLIYIFVVSSHTVVGTSMLPNFKDGQFILTDNLTYRFHNPSRGDVIVFQYDPTEELIKRVIGLPGDRISIKNGHVYINDIQLVESAYLSKSVITDGGPLFSDGNDQTVPKDEYFVLGDNRSVSEDSRYFGFITKSEIKGRVFIIYYPFNEIEHVPSIKYILENSTLQSK